MKIRSVVKASVALVLVAILLATPLMVAAARSWPVESSGSSGRNVVTIQYLLKARGYTVSVDGAFGPGTTTAVKSFQSSQGLSNDGVVGTNTWEKLVMTIQYGSTNANAVKAVQDQLANRYGYSVTVDGVFGNGTKNAVISFQQSRGLTADGVVGLDTWCALVGGTVSGGTTRLTHAQALSQLNAAGITVSSSGGCSDRNNSSCTSLDQIRQSTITGIINFKRASGCTVVVTGGTETGHASGTYSHWNGYKVDISKSAGGSCLNYIINNYTSIGGSKYQDASGNVYYNEDSYHWDITYY